MSQTGTGITSFDVPNLLAPMQDCLAKMQTTLGQDKKNLVNEMNRDPVPQFTHDQIKDATVFLQDAACAMLKFMDDFKKDAFKDIGTERLQQMQEMARESARQLVLLLGDHSSRFNGWHMQSAMVEIRENMQASTIRNTLTGLQEFLKTFGSARWLGQSIADKRFEDKKNTAIAVLSGLLSPTKVQQVANVANGHGYYGQQYKQYGQQYHQQPSQANPLKQPDQMLQPEEGTTAAYLKCLDQQCKLLADILEQDRQNIAAMQHRLGMKMAALKDFAHVLNRIPAVLNSYVLVRLSHVSATDSRMLKQWISHEEATEIHKMLEAFRDDVIQERAMREIQDRLLAASSGRCSELSTDSMKEYLFHRSMCAESDGHSAADEWSDVREAEVQVRTGDNRDELPLKGKPSHHQRARKAKFRASIPRTPSSGTHQS